MNESEAREIEQLIASDASPVGIVLAIFPFDHPNPLLNAITWLSLVAVSIPLIMWGLWYVDNRTLRRSVQLAAVLSVIVNLTVMVFLAWFVVAPRFVATSRKLGALTISDFLGHRYNSMVLRRLSPKPCPSIRKTATNPSAK